MSATTFNVGWVRSQTVRPLATHRCRGASATDLPPAEPSLPDSLPETGIGDAASLALFTQLVESRSARLGAPDVLAHMNPPTPTLAVRLVGLNAAHNQNLLHPDLGPFATEAERRVIDWLAPTFGMTAGHLCAGSTIANLATLWSAREHGAARVVASSDAHVSVAKAAPILGMAFEPLRVDERGRAVVPADGAPGDAALVLTAGTTGRGAIDPLARTGAPAGCTLMRRGRARCA